MPRTRTQVAAVVVALAGVTAAVPAHASSRFDVHFIYELTTQKPDTPSGGHVQTVYNDPGEANGKPKAARRVEIVYPEGSVYDHSQLPGCKATDAELNQRGRDACPKDTQIGEGEAELITGFGPPVDPVQLDVSVFNTPNSHILLMTFKGTNTTAAVRREYDKGRLHWTDNPPSCVPPGQPPGCEPFGEFGVKRFEVWDPPPGYVVTKSTSRTPPTCPAVGYWIFTARFVFADGSSVTRPSKAPCEGARNQDLPPRKACVDKRRFTFKLHHFRRARVVDVVVYVNGRKTKHVHRKRIRRVTIGKLPKKKFRVKVVATQSTGSKTISVRTYRGCKKGPVRSHAVHGR